MDDDTIPEPVITTADVHMDTLQFDEEWEAIFGPRSSLDLHLNPDLRNAHALP